MSHVMRKPVYAICEQQRRRSDCADNLFMPYANNKGADQPAHLRSLISAFVIRRLDSIMSISSKSKLSNYSL